ncbi:hypothetical protein OTU49_004966 [Cherax quadricarinatus]|uniref:Fucosyltransferase n=1 Tax=Cherax quadricarinatus TaxID=27406 RepID=A0AAW0X9X2_CHEQU
MARIRKRVLLYLGLACVYLALPPCYLAARSLYTAVGTTLDDYFSRLDDHINYDYYEDVPRGVAVVNKREFSATLLRLLRQLVRPRQEENPKVVLFWTSWFRRAWWGRLRGGVNLEGSHCPETRCEFTHDRSRLPEAALVLFQSEGVRAEDLPEGSRPSDQRWVWVHVEAPPASSKAFSRLHHPQKRLVLDHSGELSGLFNWTMTYHSASQIMEPYGGLIPRKLQVSGAPKDLLRAGAPKALPQTGVPQALRQVHDPHPPTPPLRPALLDIPSPAYKAYLRALDRGSSLEEVMGASWSPFVERDEDGVGEAWEAFLRRPRLVAWMASHCHVPSRREEYVAHLQKYVSVDVYGRCGSLRCGERRQHRNDTCWRKILAPKYLFYLAFENSACDDYITEKLWRPLLHGVVPVVLGGADYSKFLPPHSYINAQGLQPRELGRILRELEASPEEYSKFHLWRGFWRATLRPPLCELCLKAHRDFEVATQVDIPAWWREIGRCRDPLASLDLS